MVLVTTICKQINGLSSSATHQDLSTTVTCDRYGPCQDPSYWQRRGEGWRVCARPKAGRGDVAEKSLWGDLAF